MANGKKSFILYCDQKGTWEKLDNEQAGKLIKHIIAYVNDDNPPEPDFVTGLAFEPIKAQLKRDLKKWENQHERRVEAGRKGGQARANNAKQDQAKPSNAKQIQANQAVNGNVNVNVNASVNVNDIKEIVNYLNGALGSKYKHSTETTKASIQARFNQGFTVEDFKQVIDIKVKDWGSRPDMVQFLRPQTLFGTKFESYLNQVEATESREEQLDVELLKHLKNVRSTSNNSKPSVFSRVSTIPEVGTGKATD